MIRINLIRNRVQDTDGATAVGVDSGSESASEMRSAIFKLVMILLPMVALYLWEHNHLDTLQSRVAGLRAQLQNLENQAAIKEQEAVGVSDVEKQAKELQDKLAIIRMLSKLRLREIKTLDFIQSAIPERVWLRAIGYTSSLTDFHGGSFKVLGGAASTEDLSEFVKRLEESSYLKQVIVVKNQEAEFGLTGKALRDFDFRAQVEATQ